MDGYPAGEYRWIYWYFKPPKDIRYGNTHWHAIDGIIIHYLMKRQMHYIYKTFGLFLLMPVTNQKGLPLSQKKNLTVGQSFTKIYLEIQSRGHPTISKTTVQRHLNKLVDAYILNAYGKRSKWHNESLYGLAYGTITAYLLYFRRLENKYHLSPKIFFRPYVP